MNSLLLGNFGKVYKGDMVMAGDIVEVAVKSVIHKTEKDRRNFRREMIIMSKIVHPNVVRLYGLIPHGNYSWQLFSHLANLPNDNFF